MNHKLLPSLSTTPVLNAAREALNYITRFSDHEEGGFILVTEDAKEAKFFPVKNGIPAPSNVSLYEPGDEEMGDVFEAQDAGMITLASFHNHPLWSDTPSDKDLRFLFRGHRVNYIYSYLHDTLAAYDTEGELIHRWFGARKEFANPF